METLLQFKKSSFCHSCDCCVEVAISDNIVLVRDSKNPTQKPLTFTKEEWIAFKKGIINGEF